VNDLEFEFIRKDGTTFPLVSAGDLRPARQYLMSRSTIFDNTERKKQKRCAKRDTEPLAIEEAPDAMILLILRQGARMNRAFEAMTGIGSGQFAGHTVAEMGLLRSRQAEQLRRNCTPDS
jgi:PAS domain-containing protein